MGQNQSSAPSQAEVSSALAVMEAVTQEDCPRWTKKKLKELMRAMKALGARSVGGEEARWKGNAHCMKCSLKREGTSVDTGMMMEFVEDHLLPLPRHLRVRESQRSSTGVIWRQR